MTTEAYYQDDAVTLYHGDSLALMAGMDAESVAAVLTDPPYSERTHVGARTNSALTPAGGSPLTGVGGFTSMTDEGLAYALAECGRLTRGWVVATLAYQHAFAFDAFPPDGLRCLRLGVWVKTNPTPQISGDRPGQGWESIAYLHRADRKPSWNGGGKAGNYVLPVQQGEGHPTTKPISMVQDWVARFTAHGDIVLDPFAGSGTTLVAAKALGRKAIGVELEERYCEIAARRLAQDVLDFGGVA